LHPTRLSPLEIDGSTRFQWVLWRRLFHETRRAGEANRYGGGYARRHSGAAHQAAPSCAGYRGCAAPHN
jgi:hypothetical protein